MTDEYPKNTADAAHWAHGSWSSADCFSCTYWVVLEGETYVQGRWVKLKLTLSDLANLSHAEMDTRAIHKARQGGVTGMTREVFPWSREANACRIQGQPEWERALNRAAARRRVALKRRIRAEILRRNPSVTTHDPALGFLPGASEPTLVRLALQYGVAVA